MRKLGFEGFHAIPLVSDPRQALPLIAEEVGLIGPHRLPEPEEGEDDGEPHGGLGRRDGDNEESEELPVVVRGVDAVVRDQREVYRVEHQLDAHEQDEQVAPEEEAYAPVTKSAAEMTRKYSRGIDVVTSRSP